MGPPDSAERTSFCEGRFTLDGILGRGAMGVVYRAFDHVRGELVALKTMHAATPASLYRLKQEFRTITDVSHPNLVSIYELLNHDAHWFFSMEWVQGQGLTDYVRMARSTTSAPADDSGESSLEAHGTVRDADSGGATSLERFGSETASFPRSALSDPMPPTDVLAAPACDIRRLRPLLPQLVEGVRALHIAHLLHRDIKPSNIMVTDEGRLVLLDFGVATHVERVEGVFAGTPAFMAPEQLRGERPTQAADWYGVGATLLYLLTGHTPASFRSEASVASDAPIPRASSLADGIPEDIDNLCAMLLAPSPDERPTYEQICAHVGLSQDRSGPVATRNPEEAAFAGRAKQLRALKRAFERSRDGHVQVALVSGESGMGKSTLVERFLRELHADGALIFRGRCFANETVPFKGLDALIDSMVTQLERIPPETLVTLLPAQFPALCRMFPVCARLTAGTSRRSDISDPQLARRAAFNALQELLTRLADYRPAVCYVDDVQWSDEDSAALLAHILNHPSPPNIFFVLSYRVEEAPSPMTRALVALEKTNLVSPIYLGPLTDDEAHEVIALTPQAAVLTKEDYGMVAKEAGGSPLFLRELMHHIATNTESTADSVTLELLIAKRAERLSRDAQQLLYTVAVGSRPQPTERLRRALPASVSHARPISELRNARLVRTLTQKGQEHLECYHDRIRQCLVDDLTLERRRAIHHALAITIEALEPHAYEELAHHFDGAGVAQKAAEYAILAAEEARATLAFERAAEFYRRALTHTRNEQDISSLQRELAHSLVHAGRNRDAAEQFQILADRSEGLSRLENLRMCAQYRIAHGDVTRGLSVLREVLDEVGERLPETPEQAFTRLVWARARIKLRGYKFTPVPEDSIPPRTLAAIDACWSASLTLIWFDNFRSAYFQARCLLLALAAGEPFRIARSLCLESGMLSVKGERAGSRPMEILDKVTELNKQLKSPYLNLFGPMCTSNLHYQVTGNYEEGIRQARLGLDRLKAHPELAYERATANNYIMWQLYYLGRPKALREQAMQVRADAEARGDRYALNAVRAGLPSFYLLAEDELDACRRGCEQVLRESNSEHGAHLQHYFGVFGLAQAELYDDNPERALELVETAWPRLKRAQMLRIEVIRFPLLHVRVRALLRLAEKGNQPKERLRAARRLVRRLAGRTMPIKQVMHRLSMAGVLSLEAETDKAVACLAEAEAICNEHGLALFGLAAQHAGARITHDDELLDATEARMRSLGLRQPQKIARLLAPVATPRL